MYKNEIYFDSFGIAPPNVLKYLKCNTIQYEDKESVLWSADIVDIQSFVRYNKGIRYVLTVLYIFSKIALVLPLKDKTGTYVTEAISKMIKPYIPKLLNIFLPTIK